MNNKFVSLFHVASCFLHVYFKKKKNTFHLILVTYQIPFVGKSILQVPDTGTGVLDNTRPFLHSSTANFWITPARSKERKYHIFRQCWYTRNVPVFTNTGTFQYLGPEVYCFQPWFYNFFILFLAKWALSSWILLFINKTQERLTLRFSKINKS